MEFVILFTAIFCCTIYSTSGQNVSELACASDKFDKPCLKKCNIWLEDYETLLYDLTMCQVLD